MGKVAKLEISCVKLFKNSNNSKKKKMKAKEEEKFSICFARDPVSSADIYIPTRFERW